MESIEDRVLAELMADYPPEDRDDPRLQAIVRDTFGYQSMMLHDKLRERGLLGRFYARGFRRKLHRCGLLGRR